jgi:hypothetical protein
MPGKAAGSPAYWRCAATENAASVSLRGLHGNVEERSVSVGCAPAGPGQRKETLDTGH